MKLNLEILNLNSAFDVAQDWRIQAKSSDIGQVLQQPYRIACVPAMCTRPENFAYDATATQIDFGQFDLVVISDIEQERTPNIDTWIQEHSIKLHVLAQGAIYESDCFNLYTTVLRSWWMQNLMRMNTYQNTQQESKPYLFEVLLGARRPHRDFVMLSMQKHFTLLEKSIVTYRDVFYTGAVVNEQTLQIHKYFPDIKLDWPYVSASLDPVWEVTSSVEKNISPFVPWKIYRNTWYSAICETGFTGDGFFLTEKTTKALFAQRLFVLFGPCQFLKHLRELGFETFGSVIDEEYDRERVDLVRYRKAFAQMLSLAQQDPINVYKKIQPVLQHNYHRLWELQRETQQQQQKLLQQHIPSRHIVN